MTLSGRNYRHPTLNRHKYNSPLNLLRFGTGFIAYLGLMLSRFTGENFLDKSKPKNVFDSLFFHCVAMVLLVYAIAIPFFLGDYTSLPLTVGIRPA